MTEREIFFEALEMGTPEARAAYLQGACGRDVTLRRKVEELLKEHFSNDSLLAGSALEGERPGIVESPVGEAPAQMIGRYKLLEKLGEGGFGEVWMAEQREPVKRRVALKIIKLGMDSRQIVARFEAERQALAMMDHANIARIFDADVTDNGRPYFVMELVRGIKVTEYCDQNQLPTRQRLNLFILVCQAIQHAHQKGIIHRDIKPSNILVTLHDGVPVPKVIDFGIAKATQQELTDKTVFTQFQQFIGTPAYISPEQAEMSGLDIDTRADIYSLGVLLYELLVGQTPFDPKEMLQGGLDALRQIIREKEPLRPSTKLNTLQGDARTTVGKRRQTDVGKLVHQLEGDLDWIVMKCLEKDRTRRYDTANGLGMDIQRHVNDEAVLARPPSAAYRFQKLVRRNKLAFAAAAAVACVLVLGLVVSMWQAVRATRAEHEQSRLRRAAEEARTNEATQRQRAEDEALISRQNLYAADMSLAQQAWDSGNLGRTRSLLQAHWPRPGQADLRGFEWRYFWNLCHGDDPQTITGHSDIITCVAFSPDSQLLASGSKDQTVKLWHVPTRQLLGTLPSHDDWVNSVAFSPDGRILATSGDDAVRLWNVAARTHLSTVPVIWARSVFSPVGKIIAMGTKGDLAGASGGDVVLWDYAEGKELFTLPQAGSRAAFTPDGKILATANWKGAIGLWDASTGERLRNLADAGKVMGLVFSPDGETLAASNWSGEVHFWRVATGESTAVFRPHPTVVWQIAFSTDGNTFATSSTDQTIRLWDVATRRELACLRGHGNEVWALAFSPDGKTLASGGKDETVMLWSAEPPEHIQNITNVVSPPAISTSGNALASVVAPPLFSSDSQVLATGSAENTVVLWHLANRQPLGVFTNARIPLAISADGKVLTTLSPTNAVQRWDVTTRALQSTVPLAQSRFPMHWAKLSPDGRILAGAGFDKGVSLWNSVTGELLDVVQGSKWVRGRAFSPDGRLLATGADDGTAQLLDLAARRELFTLKAHKNKVISVTFSPDGQIVATASYDDTVGLWSTHDGRQVASLVGHFGGAYGVTFSPDARTVASASGNGDVKLWNVATLREVATLKHDREVNLVVFSPDGQTLATVDNNQMLHLWNAPSPSERDGSRR